VLRAILIDMDGTLCESEEAHREAFNRAFAEAGLPWRWEPEPYRELLAVKGGRDRLRRFLATAEPRPADPDGLAATLHALKTDLFGVLVARGGLTPRPGVLRLMAEARGRGVRLALVTSATRPTAAPLVRAVLGRDLDRAFDAAATGDRAAANKPAPDLYETALSDLGLSPDECVAIEDDGAGLAAATAAGIATIITPSAYGRDEDRSAARAVLSDLGEPDAPGTALAGPAPPEGVADLDWLAALLAP
jgi:HAD superfamily hydrolase (TIGR01509 family)